MSQGYFTVKGETENLIVIERSKFICNIAHVEDELQAKAYVETIRKRHSLANHNCYAYIADDKGLIQKFSDDGEPQGTAGLPMLDVLKNKKIYKTVAVVTRYFGGIKLGTGGLTRAYGGSVVECLSKSQILDMQPSVFVNVYPDYDGYSRLLKLISNENIAVIDTIFEDTITVKLSIKEFFVQPFIDKLTDAFNGKIKTEVLGRDFYAFR